MNATTRERVRIGSAHTKLVYEPETKTMRLAPQNYWIASMDSWDGAVDHDYNA